MKVTAIALTALLSVASALELNVTDAASIKSAASKIASNLVKTYPLDESYLFPFPYYWQTVAFFLETILTYTRYTKDQTIFPISSINSAFTHQIGDDNFMPLNVSSDISHEDQSYFALAALTGVENEMLEDAEKWENVVKNVWNGQASRWDDKICGGGLSRMIFSFSSGYAGRGSVTHMNFFLLSARLAAYTDNSTYADWANKVYDWSEEVGLIGPDGQVFAGAINGDCTEIDKDQWSVDAAKAAYGAAIMETLNNSGNVTQWQERKTKLLSQFTEMFAYEEFVLEELFCENRDFCNEDQKAWKGVAAHYLSKIAQLDSTYEAEISRIMEASAKAAAASCQDDGTCGFVWIDSTFDNDTGVGQQMNALRVITNLFALEAEKKIEREREAAKTATANAPSATGTAAASGAASNTATDPATVSQTGAAASFGVAHAVWGIGALALSFAALL